MSAVVSLLRVSTAGQVATGSGLLAQRASIAEYCEREGLVMKAEFVENGVSGSTPIQKREQLLMAIAALEKGDQLVVAKYDRLSRVMIEQLTIEKIVSKKGCRIVSSSNVEASGDDPANSLMRNMLAAIAEFERQLISQRTRMSVKARVAAGKAVSSAPYGFRISEDKTLVCDDKEVRTLKMIESIRNRRFGRFGDRKTSWRRVAEILNEQGMLKRNSKPWSAHNVWQTWTNHQKYSHLI